MSVAKGVPKYEGKVNALDTMMTLRNVQNEGREYEEVWLTYVGM